MSYWGGGKNEKELKIALPNLRKIVDKDLHQFRIELQPGVALQFI